MVVLAGLHWVGNANKTLEMIPLGTHGVATKWMIFMDLS
jgi:hypothetical protein